jgi:urease accessory protein
VDARLRGHDGIGLSTSLLRLLTWLSPAFPTGGFAYSHGLEWSVEAGGIKSEIQLLDWISDTLTHGALWSDVVLLRHVVRARPEDLTELASLATALCPSAERRLETLAQGAAFRLAASAWYAPDLENWSDDPLPYPIAVGLLAAAQTIAEDDVAVAYLHACTANFVSAAVRLIPLGQSTGLRVQAALEPAIMATASTSKTASLDDIGTSSWASDIAAMRHETQHTRLFRT